MATTFRCFAAVILTVIMCQFNTISAVQRGEMDSMLTALRSNGYGLFSNAIVTSDLSYDLVDGGDAAFTVFAPTDSSLFALDMVNSASDYTATLRCHVVPQRLSILGLSRLRPGSSLRTLAADHDLRVESRQSLPSGNIISVNGVDVVMPGMFYARNIAVHGLRGILNCRSRGSAHEVLVRQPESPSRSAPPVVARTGAPSLEANLTIDHSNSTDSNRIKRLPKSRNFSDDNSSFVHSPIGNYKVAPSPSIKFSDYIDPPSAAPISSTIPHHTNDIFSPSYSPATIIYFPPDVQQAFGTLSTDTPTAPYFSPVTGIDPPEPEFSENDDPPSLFSPSPATMLNRGIKKASIVEIPDVFRKIPVISLDHSPETTEGLGPSDEKTAADCPASEESAHVKFNEA
ncbi:unnamed protein product [Cuscuta europaea]|uniref:FAS1 domain-containing protein n=1 Tax=Cuscuta europaea TaxID=41803 RepID=A0A9P1E6D7_CUSEU|nr:unnamed protein product [Cuscuta europaea]